MPWLYPVGGNAHGNHGADLLTYTQTTLLDKPAIPVDANASLRVALENLAVSITES